MSGDDAAVVLAGYRAWGGFPRDKRVDEFDFAANPNVPAGTVHQLAGRGWVKAGQPLCLIGDSGTGKTHLLISPGHRGRAGRALRSLGPGQQAG